ncbi:hypothetical protein BC937DRAFT_93046 [Endogone sp. FLAS-F59071]|nr:hypothetical protein BC937DRAFT_93046 [Endogone sp. FLAS-F59071]|eukprot:RUS21316.1 hypothetical protein BC937DRAFT_93046 [Endogone sp. FLAS-F59071]
MAVYHQQMQGFLGQSSTAANVKRDTKQLVSRTYKDHIMDRFQNKYPQYFQAKSDRENELQRKNAKRHPLTHNSTRQLNKRANPTLLEWCNPEDPNIQENISDPELEHCTTSSCEWPVWEIIEVKVTETWCITNDAQYNGQSVEYAEDDFVAVSLEACLSDPELDAALAKFDLSPICAGADGKWYPGRGVLDLEGEVDILVSILHARAGGTIKLWESEEAFCSGPERCQKDFCYMDMFHFYEEVHVWVDLWIFGTKDIYGPRTYNLPRCDPNDGGSSIIPGSHPYGKVVKRYYPNWTFYHSDNQIIEITNDMASMLTHINYAFAMVSYQPDLDVYYLDPSVLTLPITLDLYADFGTCASLLDIQCQLSNLFGEDTTTCIPVDATAQCAPGVISLVPFWGAKNADGSCPVPSKNCYNAGGPEGGRNPPCTTQIDGTTLKESQDDTTILACGQFNYLFNLMDQRDAGASNIRIMLSIGGWYDASYFTPATDDTHYEAFTDSIVSILDFFPFDGIDIDWEFPGFEHGDEPVYGAVGVGDREVTQDCIATTCQYAQRRNDPAQYVRFLQTLRSKLNTAGPNQNGVNRHGDKYEISIAAASGWDKYQYLDKAAVCQAITHVNMMSYDMHGAWDTITNHQAPIYDNTPDAVGRQYSIDDAITGWTQGGCDASKIVLGIPLYSRTEVGVSPGYAYGDPNLYSGLYQPFSGPQEDATAMPTFGQLVSDPGKSFCLNVLCYIGEKGLAGAMYWLMGQDSSDNRGLKAMYSNLDCTTPEPKMTNPPPTAECQIDSPLSKRSSCPVGTTTPYYDMAIHMVQVGRGDSFVLEFNYYECTGVPAVDDQSTCGDPVDARVFLIDGGSAGQGSESGAHGNLFKVLQLMEPVVINKVTQKWKIDYVIATHSDSGTRRLNLDQIMIIAFSDYSDALEISPCSDNPYDPDLRTAIGVRTSTARATSCGRLYSANGQLNDLTEGAYITAVGVARTNVYSAFLGTLKYHFQKGYKLAWDSTLNNQPFSTTYNDDLNLPPLLEFAYSGDVKFQQHYRFLKVPHHCSPDSMTPGGTDYYWLTADFYLISGQTSGSTLQPGAKCLEAIIQQRVKRAHEGNANWEVGIYANQLADRSNFCFLKASSENYLDKTIQGLNPNSNAWNYRLYVLQDSLEDNPVEAVFVISSTTGEVLVNSNDFIDLTAQFWGTLPATYTLAKQDGYIIFP